MALEREKPSSPPRPLRPAAWVRDMTRQALTQAGALPEVAEAVAEAIIEAHLRGIETHGIRRLRPYLARIRAGGVDPLARPEITRRGAVLSVDGRNGIGHYVATFAARAVSDLARETGIALGLVRNSNHFGFAGHYATLIAQREQIGIVISNGQVCVGPEGAKAAFVSNNPLAIAAPTGRPDAFFELDLATSATSRANVVQAAKTGDLLPPGWAQDREGAPTRDAAAALGGSLLAFGGPRGFSLLLALEALTGLLSGGAYADQVSSKEAAPQTPEGTCHTFVAIDLETALGAATFRARIDDFLGQLCAMPVRDDAPAIRYPGERRWSLRRQRLQGGVPLSAEEEADLEELSGEPRRPAP